MVGDEVVQAEGWERSGGPFWLRIGVGSKFGVFADGCLLRVRVMGSGGGSSGCVRVRCCAPSKLAGRLRWVEGVVKRVCSRDR